MLRLKDLGRVERGAQSYDSNAYVGAIVVVENVKQQIDDGKLSFEAAKFAMTEGTGPIIATDNQVSLSSGTIVLRATIANPDHGLLPGRFVTATLHLGDLQGALCDDDKAVVAGPEAGRTRRHQATSAADARRRRAAGGRPAPER